MPKQAEGIYLRLVANIHEPENEQACWLWKGVTDKHGYGRISTWVPGKGSRKQLVHVVMLAELGVEVPPGHERDHTCNVRHCINPDHLEVVTKQENIRRIHERARHPQGPQRAG